MLAEEVRRVNKQVGHTPQADGQFLEAWRNAMSEMIYLPAQQRYGRIASATNSDKVDSLQVSPFSSHSLVLCCVVAKKPHMHTCRIASRVVGGQAFLPG